MKNRFYLLTLVFTSCANKIKKLLLVDQRGAILVALIFGMVIVAGMGAALISMNTTTAFNQFGANDSMKAYYLAEAGRRYVVPRGSAGEDIQTNIPSPTTFTLANSDKFVITDTLYGNLLNFSFRSTGTTTASVNRGLNYARSTNPANRLSIDPDNALSEGGGNQIDESFDNNCEDSHGYRSDEKGPPSGSGVTGVAYIGYDMTTPENVLFLEYAGGRNSVNSIASAKFQGSDNINFGVIGAEITLTLNTDPNPRNDPCVPRDFQAFILPTTWGAFRYWRLLANAEPADNEQWEVQEFRMFGGGAGGMVETQF